MVPTCAARLFRCGGSFVEESPSSGKWLGLCRVSHTWRGDLSKFKREMLGLMAHGYLTRMLWGGRKESTWVDTDAYLPLQREGRKGGSNGPLITPNEGGGQEPKPTFRSWERPISVEESAIEKQWGREPWKEMLDQLDRPGMQPDCAMYAYLLRWCGNAKALSEGKSLHTHIIKSGHDRNRFLGNLLVQMYGKCGALIDASDMFARIHRRNVFSWTIMIGAYAQHGQVKKVLQLFQDMQSEGVMPNKVTLVNIFSACANQAALFEGRWMHGHIVGSLYESDIVVGNAIINMYGKCGSIEDARRMFDKMPGRDVVSWTAMIAAYARHGEGKEALQLFEKMQLEGVIPNKVTFVSILDAYAGQESLPEGKWLHAHIVACGFESDVTVGNALINMYEKCGSLEDARRIFDKMPERNVITWTAMIASYTHHGQGRVALDLFQRMQLEGLAPDRVTFMSIFDACASIADLAEGKRMHVCLESSEIASDVVMWNALVNMYGKCGSPKDARMVFDHMTERSVVSWNAMFAAYAQHGLGKEVVQLYQLMQLDGVIPDKVTFVSILCACSHTGLVDEGCHYFVSTSRDYGIKPIVEHFNCMIDLLGRAGRLDEGEDLIINMPFEPTSTSWMTLLAACKMHSDVARGRHATENVLELDPENASPYVSLSNIYAAALRWDDAVKVRKVMKDKVCRNTQIEFKK